MLFNNYSIPSLYPSLYRSYSIQFLGEAPKPRAAPASCSHGEDIYFFGGDSGVRGGYCSDMHRLDTVEAAWKPIVKKPGAVWPSERFRSLFVCGNIFIFELFIVLFLTLPKTNKQPNKQTKIKQKKITITGVGTPCPPWENIYICSEDTTVAAPTQNYGDLTQKKWCGVNQK